jgi:hypothetical protein
MSLKYVQNRINFFERQKGETAKRRVKHYKEHEKRMLKEQKLAKSNQ